MKTQISTLTKLKVWTVVSLTAKDTLMVILESFKQGFAVEATSKSMAWTTFDTFASVVSWTTGQILLVLSAIFGLDMKQVDYNYSFLQAPITENVYFRIPSGFQEVGKFLKLEKSLYELRQSPRNVFEKANLLKNGIHPIICRSMSLISHKVVCLL